MKKLFFVTALFNCSQLLSQDSIRTMDEVTLTATKFSIKTTETGKLVTIISKQDIEHAGSRDLAQVITELGGVFINGFNSNPGKEKNIYLRGARVDYTLITLDGVPVYDASGIGSNFDIRNISIDNVERIEILKGSQSTLYGSDAIAGVINIITKKGGTKPFSVSGVTNYGSFHTFRGHLDVSGSQSAFYYNLGYSHTTTDGFSEAKPMNSTEEFDKDGYQQNSLNINLGINPGQFIRLQPFFRYTIFKGDLDQDAFTDETDFTNTNKNLQAGIKNTLAAGKAQVTVLYQFINTKRNYLDDSTKTRNGFYHYNQQAYNAREHFAEAFVVYPFHKVKVTAGTDFRSSNTDYDAVQYSFFGISKPSQSGDSVKQSQVGVYAALNYASGKLSMEGGGRFNHHSEYGDNFAFNVNPSYFFGRRVKLFGNLSSGYKTPSLYQLFSVYGNKNLEPESSLNIEGGLQLFTNNEKSSIRFAFFDRHIKDAIAFFYNPATFQSVYINQDEQKDHGIEIEINAKLSDKFQLRGSYSYVTGKITTRQNGKDTTYFNLLRRPKSLFNLFLGSRLTKAFYVNAQLNLIGQRNDVYFSPPTYEQQHIELDPYALLNFYAEYGLSNNRLKIFADLRNLLDRDYSDIYGYNTAGFNFYGGVRFKF